MPVNVKSFSKAKSRNGNVGSVYGLSIADVAKKLINDTDSQGSLTCANAPVPTSMAVIAGANVIGNKDVIRADSDYYGYDVIILKNLSNEVWIKLPPPYNINGTSHSQLEGKTLKIKNLTAQNCYVYVQDSGYRIYSPDSASYASYYNIGNGAAEFLWTGSEWLWFRCN